VVPAAELQARAEAIVLGGRVKRFRQPFAARLSRRLIDRTRLGRWFVSLVTRDAIVAESEGRRPLPPHLLVLNALKRRKIRKGNFPAPYGALKVALAALTSPEPQAFALESTTFAQLATTEVSRNLVGIFFATEESKKAPLNARATITVKKVGVAGAGVMGAGIAQAALYAGYEVVLYDKFPQGLEKGVATIKGLFAGLVEKGKLTQERVDAILANLSTTTDTSGFVGCDLVVEAIVEDMGAKKAFLAELDRHVGKEYIFATNTSSLSVSEMAAEAAHPENTGGLHFFNPVHKMPLVEVVAGRQTSNATIAALKTFAGKLGKTPVTTADAPGFVVNRILAPYLYEAIVLMEQGVPLKDIEDAMRRFGMPMGPLALLDEVGLDIATKVIHVLNEALGARLNPPAILEFIQTNKLLGKKGGKGIYLYDERGKRLGFNPEFVAALPAANTQPMDQLSIQRRLVLAMVNEAARCLEEGVIDDPAQLDLAMLFGTGFPPFRGGVLRYADSLGCALVAQNLEWLSRVHGDNYKPSAYLLGKARAGSRFYA
jgi:3-hydroxyacyl-CoA dehydrogenase/enoyl-CoA hydratase/3-hydroxybutyryl-CoA epimerase